MGSNMRKRIKIKFKKLEIDYIPPGWKYEKGKKNKPWNTPSYVFNEKGRNILYKDWIRSGGSGIPNHSNAPLKLGPVSYWDNVTLGDISDACPYTGRCLARFAANNDAKVDSEYIFEKITKKESKEDSNGIS